MKNWSVTFKGFNNKQEAEAFAEWYCNQGEQFISEDGMKHVGVTSADVDVNKTYPLDCNNDNVDIFLKVKYVCD